MQTVLILLFTIYLPIAQAEPTQKGVAWAYGKQNVGDEQILNVSSCHVWGMYRYCNGLDNLNHFWSDCYPSPADCRGDYWEDLAWLAAQTDYTGMVTYDGRPIVMLLNEPDLPKSHNQAFKSPTEAAVIYQMVKAICPECAFFGLKVSAYDMYCDYPSRDDWQPWHYEITAKYDDWCYFREWWSEVERLTGDRPYMSGYNIHHYYNIDWHIPRRDLSPLDPVDSLEAVARELGDSREFIPFVIAEFGTCDPEFMTELVTAYENDERVIRYYGWTPNRPVPDACEVFFSPFGSQNLTEVGKAFSGGVANIESKKTKESHKRNH